MDEHTSLAAPSFWIERWRGLFEPNAEVLDVACGGGRHSFLLANWGLRVTAVDRNPQIRDIFKKTPGITPLVADLEQGSWPFDARQFSGIVVTHYLYRPLFPSLFNSLSRDGVLLYETFMSGNERYGSPRNVAFLLAADELLDLAAKRVRVVAFEQGTVELPRRVVVQRLCAVGFDYPREIILR